MIKIELQRSKWQYDPQHELGGGSFGIVYKGVGSDGTAVAIKKLFKSDGAEVKRERNMAEFLVEQDLRNVMPVFDAGEDDNSKEFYVVMALADMNLREKLQSHSQFTESETLLIAKNVVDGLIEVNDIVHRDLKPENILLHDGVWKLADFGIARFDEANTSQNTLKLCMSPIYAAPEQWRMERTTKKTDIYALGCILQELLTGMPPFIGNKYELRQQHLKAVAPELKQVEPGLRKLVSSMLRKFPDSRIDLERISKQLIQLQKREARSPGQTALREAGAHIEMKEAEREAINATQQIEEQRRNEIALEGHNILVALKNRLIEQIAEDIPGADFNIGSGYARHGHGMIQFEIPAAHLIVSKSAFQKSGWNVVAHGSITVTQRRTEEYVRSSSLIYAAPENQDQFRWWEVCLMNIGANRITNEPFAGTIQQIDVALADILDNVQIAAPIRAIDDEDFVSFEEEWLGVFAEAVKGELRQPRDLPLTA